MNLIYYMNHDAIRYPIRIDMNCSEFLNFGRLRNVRFLSTHWGVLLLYEIVVTLLDKGQAGQKKQIS